MFTDDIIIICNQTVRPTMKLPLRMLHMQFLPAAAPDVVAELQSLTPLNIL